VESEVENKSGGVAGTFHGMVCHAALFSTISPPAHFHNCTSFFWATGKFSTDFSPNFPLSHHKLSTFQNEKWLSTFPRFFHKTQNENLWLFLGEFGGFQHFPHVYYYD
jgi:hypothetical protein